MDGIACHDDACLAGSCTSGACQPGSTSVCDPCLVCDGDGACVPPTACRAPSPRGASLTFQNDADPAHDSVSWRWKAGSGTAKDDFGTPLTSTDFGLCVYEPGGLVWSAHAPAGGVCGSGSCWRDLASGFGYRDRERTPDGVAKLDLKAGRSGRGNLRLRGRGANLSLPGRGLALPVTVRLILSDGGACWEAVYSSPSRNDATRFDAKSD
jgi:hypothetical protein